MHVLNIGRERFADGVDGDGVCFRTKDDEVLPPFRDAINERISASVLANDFASISFCLSTPASSGLSRSGP